MSQDGSNNNSALHRLLTNTLLLYLILEMIGYELPLY